MTDNLLTSNLSKEALLHLIDSLPGHVCWKDLEGRYVACNKQFANLFNFDSAAGLIGKSDFDLIDSSLAERVWQNDQEVMLNNVSKDFIETAVNSQGGTAIYFSKKKPHLDQNGKVIGLICVATDITEVSNRLTKLEVEKDKKNEFISKMKYLDLIADWIPGNLWWRDVEGYYLGSNRNMLEIYRYLGAETLVGRRISDLLAPEIYKPIEETDQRIMRTGVAETLQEEGIDKQGKQATYISTKVPLRDEDGNVIGLLGTSVDITDRIQLEASLREAKETAELANQSKSEFLMNMSHDIRTPFIGIIGFAEALQQIETNKDKLELVEQINVLSQRLLGIIDDIIEMASSDPSEQDLVVKLNLASTCKAMIALMRAQAEYKDLNLSYSVDDNVPSTLYGQKVAIERILLNLLGNAIKFTKRGEITLHCAIKEKLKNNKVIVQIKVTDTGIGISKEKLGDIFAKFHKLATPKGKYKGSGLGLYFVQSLTERMGGSVHVESQKGKGACFIVELPMTTKRQLIKSDFDKNETMA